MSNDRLPEVPALAVLLGSNVKTWPYSEETLVQALQLRSQQEQTKRQYYKLEQVNQSLELLKTAVNAGIPAPQIPLLFNSETAPTNEADSTDVRQMIYAKEQSPISSIPDKQPRNYKFPPTNQPAKQQVKPLVGSEMKTHRRTHSPARIGAEAVAALNSNMLLKEEDSHGSSKASTPQTNTHKRMQSLPTLKNEPTTGVLNFSAWHTYSAQESGNNGFPKRPSTISPTTGASGPSSFPSSVRKHRRTSSTNSAFGVIDLNSINQISFKQSHSRSASVQDPRINTHSNSNSNHNSNINSNIDTKKSAGSAKVDINSTGSSEGTNDDTFSEPGSNDTSLEQVRKNPNSPKLLLKGPNYVDNLLNT